MGENNPTENNIQDDNLSFASLCCFPNRSRELTHEKGISPEAIKAQHQSSQIVLHATRPKAQYDCKYCGWPKKKIAFRHPVSRIFICLNIIWLNFLMYAEDPISHSRANTTIPIFGHGFSLAFLNYPSTHDGVYAFKLCMAIFFFISGLIIGRQFIHHYILRDKLTIRMFNHDQGTWMVMFWFTVLWLGIGSQFYNWVLDLWGHKDFQINEDIGLDNETFMKIAASGTWCGDYLTAYMVIDMILQDTEYPKWATKARAAYAGSQLRVFLFWVISIVSMSIVLSFIATNFIEWDTYGSQARFTTTEFWRSLMASVITLLDLAIVMQDWEFPAFITNQEINLPGLNTHHIRFEVSEWFKIHITGKWFNYGIIFMVMCLDANMLKNQVLYKPEDYAQYVDKAGGKQIWSITNKTEIHQFKTCIATQEIDASCLSLFTFDQRQFARVRLTDPDIKTESRFVGESDVWLAIAIIPAAAGAIMFFSLLYLENPSTLENQHLRGLDRGLSVLNELDDTMNDNLAEDDKPDGTILPDIEKHLSPVVSEYYNKYHQIDHSKSQREIDQAPLGEMQTEASRLYVIKDNDDERIQRSNIVKSKPTVYSGYRYKTSKRNRQYSKRYFYSHDVKQISPRKKQNSIELA